MGSIGGIILSITAPFGKKDGDSMMNGGREEDGYQHNNQIHNRNKGAPGAGVSPVALQVPPLSHRSGRTDDGWSTYRDYADTGCKNCDSRKRNSFWTVMALLAVDIFTICLIIILFKNGMTKLETTSLLGTPLTRK